MGSAMVAVVEHMTVIVQMRSAPLRNAAFHVACKSAERSTNARTGADMAVQVLVAGHVSGAVSLIGRVSNAT
jgi:hypothetical protein